jgi:hypothetical protein
MRCVQFDLHQNDAEPPLQRLRIRAAVEHRSRARRRATVRLHLRIDCDIRVRLVCSKVVDARATRLHDLIPIACVDAEVQRQRVER